MGKGGLFSYKREIDKGKWMVIYYREYKIQASFAWIEEYGKKEKDKLNKIWFKIFLNQNHCLENRKESH